MSVKRRVRNTERGPNSWWSFGAATQRGEIRRLALLMALPAGLAILVMIVYPMALAVISSFYEIDTVTRDRSFTGIGNYVTILQESQFWRASGRTLLWVVGSVLGQVLFALVATSLLRLRVPGVNIARGIVIFPYIVPAIVAAAVFRFMFDDLLGIVNNFALWSGVVDQPLQLLSSPSTALLTVVLVGIWKYTPFMVILLLARVQTVPGDLYEAAAIDGASRWQQFRNITFPWISPALLVAVILRIIWAFNEYDIVYLLAYGGPLDATTTLPILLRDYAFAEFQMGKSAALATIMTFVLFVGALVYFKYYEGAEDRLV